MKKLVYLSLVYLTAYCAYALADLRDVYNFADPNLPNKDTQARQSDSGYFNSGREADIKKDWPKRLNEPPITAQSDIEVAIQHKENENKIIKSTNPTSASDKSTDLSGVYMYNTNK